MIGGRTLRPMMHPAWIAAQITANTIGQPIAFQYGYLLYLHVLSTKLPLIRTRKITDTYLVKYKIWPHVTKLKAMKIWGWHCNGMLSSCIIAYTPTDTQELMDIAIDNAYLSIIKAE